MCDFVVLTRCFKLDLLRWDINVVKKFAHFLLCLLELKSLQIFHIYLPCGFIPPMLYLENITNLCKIYNPLCLRCWAWGSLRIKRSTFIGNSWQVKVCSACLELKSSFEAVSDVSEVEKTELRMLVSFAVKMSCKINKKVLN